MNYLLSTILLGLLAVSANARPEKISSVVKIEIGKDQKHHTSYSIIWDKQNLPTHFIVVIYETSKKENALVSFSPKIEDRINYAPVDESASSFDHFFRDATSRDKITKWSFDDTFIDSTLLFIALSDGQNHMIEFSDFLNAHSQVIESEPVVGDND